MRFLFREEEVKPEHWRRKEYLINVYFELCRVTMREPWFKPDEPITKANFDMAIDFLQEAEVLA
ncbi:MAG: hypothetical protein VW262_06040 [Flavobacteriaceae bacterium]